MNLRSIQSAWSVFSQIVRLNINGQRMPLFVSLQITKYCNLRCSYCFAELDSLKSASEFTTEQWKEIINELYSMGTRWIRIQGGEPLLRKDIGEIIKHIKAKGMLCELVTNGMFIRKNIESLVLLDSLCISLDGDKNANDRCRGDGVYDKVVEGIKLAKSRGLKIRIHGVLTSQSVDSQEHIAKLSKEIGGEFNVAYFSLDDSKENNEFSLTPDKIKDFYRKYLALKENGYPVSSSLSFINHILNWPEERGHTLYKEDKELLENRGLIRCLAGVYSCFIDSDGTLYTCPKRWKKGINVLSNGIKQAWEGSNNLDCIACWAYGDNEAFAIMRLRPQAIWNAIAYFLPFKKKIK